MWNDWLKSHEGLISQFIMDNSSLLGLKEEVQNQVIASMKKQLQPLTVIFKNAFTAYQKELAKQFSQTIREELRKQADLKLEKAGFSPIPDDKSTDSPIKSLNKSFDKLNADIDSLKDKVATAFSRPSSKQNTSFMSTLSKKTQNEALVNEVNDLLTRVPEKPDCVDIRSTNRFYKNLDKRSERKPLTIENFKKFQHRDAPLSLDDTVEYARFASIKNCCFEGMWDTNTKTARGILQCINYDGDICVGQYKDGKRHGLRVFWRTAGYTYFELYKDG